MKKRNAGWLGAVMLVSGLGSAAAMAHERGLRADQLPTAVKQAIASRFPNAKARHYSKDVENGKVEYEVVLQTGHQLDEVSFAPDGTVVAQELRLQPGQLPAPVRQSLGNARVLKAEKALEGTTTQYEVLVSRNGTKAELVFDSQGRPLRAGEQENGEGHERGEANEAGQEDAD